jgi:hypothetical protein
LVIVAGEEIVAGFVQVGGVNGEQKTESGK